MWGHYVEDTTTQTPAETSSATRTVAPYIYRGPVHQQHATNNIERKGQVGHIPNYHCRYCPT